MAGRSQSVDGKAQRTAKWSNHGIGPRHVARPCQEAGTVVGDVVAQRSNRCTGTGVKEIVSASLWVSNDRVLNVNVGAGRANLTCVAKICAVRAAVIHDGRI